MLMLCFKHKEGKRQRDKCILGLYLLSAQCPRNSVGSTAAYNNLINIIIYFQTQAIMWPMLLDMSKDESKRVLRRLELEAYCSIISAFRAQGDLTKDKKRILQDLQQTLR